MRPAPRAPNLAAVPMPSIVKNDPMVARRPVPQGVCRPDLFGPTVPVYWAFNPAYAQVQTEHVWEHRGGWTSSSTV